LSARRGREEGGGRREEGEETGVSGGFVNQGQEGEGEDTGEKGIVEGRRKGREKNLISAPRDCGFSFASQRGTSTLPLKKI
jgi:hypothetical protein